jgi:hypothetical protein
MQNKGLKIVLPSAALGLAIIHMLSPDKPKIDAIIVALMLIGLLPWIGRLIESLKYGDVEIKLRKTDAEAAKSYGIGGKKSADGRKSVILGILADALRGSLGRVVSANMASAHDTEALERNLDAASGDDNGEARKSGMIIVLARGPHWRGQLSDLTLDLTHPPSSKVDRCWLAVKLLTRSVLGLFLV